MAHKYKTGSYRVLLFDRYGTKVDDIAASNWTDAIAKGKEAVNDGESFVATRTIYNSLDRHSTAIRNIEEGEENE